MRRSLAIVLLQAALFAVGSAWTPAAVAAICGPENVSAQLPGRGPNNASVTAALADEKAGNYAEAIEQFRQIDAAGEEPALTLPADYPWRELVIHKHMFGLAQARNALGWLYEKGLGVDQSYAEAAKWYQKAVDTEYCGERGTSPATFNLGKLYAYGKGVPKDKSRTRALWQSIGFNSQIKLLDANALPKTMDWEHFDFKAAYAKLDRQQAAGLSERSPRRFQAGGQKREEPATQAEADAPATEMSKPKLRFNLDK